MAAIKTILEAADLISEVRSALLKIENLKNSQESMMAVIQAQDQRVRELEASLREMRAEIKLEAVQETQNIVNAVQGQMYDKITSLSVAVNRLENLIVDGVEAHSVAESNSSHAHGGKARSIK